MDRKAHRVSALTLLLSLAPGASAQTAAALDMGAAVVTRQGDRPLALGPDYRAQFAHDRVVFTPALGPQAPRSYPLSFALACVGRDTTIDRALAVDAGVLTHDARTVCYRRAGFDEVYEARTDGLKQSFVFHELPVGDGDLVVRGRLATDLSVVHADRDRIELAVDGLGGVRIDGVVGYDARGARVAGEIAFDGTRITLRLPAAFVERAELPLTLDPLLAATSLSSSFDCAPDAATGVSSRTLVVWLRTYSASDHDVMGRIVNSDGTPHSAAFVISFVQGTRKASPAVAYVSQTQRWVVAWTDEFNVTTNDVWAAVVDGSAVVTGGVRLTNVGDYVITLDLCGDVTGADADAVVVFHEFAGRTIETMQIRAMDAPSAFGRSTLATSSPSHVVERPAIAKAGGATGRSLVVWQRRSSGQHDVVGAVIDADANVLDPVVNIAAGTADEEDPDVDGDGDHWVVAWEQENVSQTGLNDIACRALSYDAAAAQVYATSGTVVIESGIENEHDPAVGWLADSVLVAFVNDSAAATDLVCAKSIDPFSANVCRTEPCRSAAVTTVAIASRVGVPGTGGALLVWDDCRATNGGTWVSGYRADDGVVTRFAASCSGGGEPHASCAVTGNAGFTMRVFGSSVSTGAAYLILSPDTRGFWCDGCLIVPDPFAGVVVNAGGTDSRGDAELPVPLPSGSALLGATFYMQWALQGSGSCPELSDALRVQIQ